MSLLDRVNDPLDLKQLTIEELDLYSAELRQFLIETMSKIGGHVAANLGVVELTAALHYVFNGPEDKIVWDVGHQCYAHKIITGRKKEFKTIRQDGGLSGFTKISESPFDAFGAGHSSTSVSAGLGLAEAMWQQQSNHQVISIIGDGALTAGMAYEGLNHAGHLRRPNYIVVFNDNGMSISQNVGALARFFGKRITSSLYNTVRGEIKEALKALSLKDLDLFEKAKVLSASVKELFMPSSFFEALGFRYVGPIDGHNTKELVETLESVQRLSLESMQTAKEKGVMIDPPILVHVKTKKGLGLKTAEKHPHTFHGVTGFCSVTGEPDKKPGKAPSYTSIFSQTLCKMAQDDPKILGITAAMPDGTGLSRFQKEFPERFYDVGIAEQHAVTFSGAMALQGMKPAVAIYSTFLQRAFDQVIHDVAIQKIPVSFFLDRSGLVGADGPTHHGIFDMTYLRCLPGMHLMAPKDENELQHMVYTSMNCGQLSAVRFPRGAGVGVPLDTQLQMLELGKSEKVFEVKGKNKKPFVIIWAAGSRVYPSITAAKELTSLGIPTEVVNARFIKPLDLKALLKDVSRCHLIATVEEGAVLGGLGSAVLESLSAQSIQHPVLNLGIPDQFIEHGSLPKLYSQCDIDTKSIVTKIIARLEKLEIPKLKVSPESAKPTVISDSPVTH